MATLKNTTIDGTLAVNGSLVATDTMTIESIITAGSVQANNVVINASSFTINGESPLTTSTFKIANFISSDSTNDKEKIISLNNINDGNDVVYIYAPKATATTFGVIKVEYNNNILKIITSK